MSDKKYRIEWFSIYDCNGIQEHLEHMMAEGWMLEKAGQLFWRYRKVEPKEVRFAVSYFARSSRYDPEPIEDQQVYLDYCKKAGWQLLQINGSMQIFYHEDKNATPLETDAVLQVEAVHNEKKGSALSVLLILLLCCYQIANLMQAMWNNPIRSFSNYALLCLVSAFVFMVFSYLLDIIIYGNWYRKAKKVAREKGLLLSAQGKNRVQKFCLFFECMLFVAFVFAWRRIEYTVYFGWIVFSCIIVALFVQKLGEWLKKRKISWEVNGWIRIATFVLGMCVVIGSGIVVFPKIEKALSQKTHAQSTFKANVPLKINDIIETNPLNYQLHTEINETCILSCETVKYSTRDRFDEMVLSYQIVRSSFPILLERGMDELLQREIHIIHNVKELDANAWLAQKAYCMQSGNAYHRYLILWDDKLLDLQTEQELTPVQIAAVVKKIRDY